MAGKITATFGADTSEIEQKMAQGMRSIKAYEAATKGVGSGGGFGRVTASLTKNERALESIKRKFGAGDLFKGILAGVGIGTGFAVAEKVAELISEHWKAAAESAKKVLEYAEKTTESVLKGIAAGQTDEQKLKFAEKDFSRTQSALMGAQSSVDADPEEIMRLVQLNQEAGNKVDEIRRTLAEKEKKRKEKAGEDAKKSAADDLDTTIANQVRNNDAFNNEQDEKKKAAKEAADFFAALDEAATKAHEENTKKQADAAKRAADLRYERTWKSATDEQRLAQIIKEGKAAQAAYDKYASGENLLALEEIRKKYLDFMQEKAATGTDLATGGRERGGDGKLRKGGVVISAEDAARSDATRARNLRLNVRHGLIKGTDALDAGEKSKADEYLKQIVDFLKPKRA